MKSLNACLQNLEKVNPKIPRKKKILVFLKKKIFKIQMEITEIMNEEIIEKRN